MTWPKKFPPLTDEQQRISDDFMHYWHEVFPNRFGIFDKWSHRYAGMVGMKRRGESNAFVTTLEVGCGIGEHMFYEQLSPLQRDHYVAVDIRSNMVDTYKQRCPSVRVLVADCQQRLPFPDGNFDRILAVHVLEHLPNLPDAVDEMHRLCRNTGSLAVVIPCDPGFAYSLARRISAQRIFEKRYGQSYQWFIEREHINSPYEIYAELERKFRFEHQEFFPFNLLPFINLNIGIGLVCRKRLR